MKFLLSLYCTLFTGFLTSAQLNVNNNTETNAITCTNWLRTLAAGQSVKVGDLDVPGDVITVEAMFNRISPSNGTYLSEDLVSKHSDPNTVNYLLRVDHAEITTTNGFFRTPPLCNTEVDKTYHVAFVYDGVTLSFFRNGFLMNQVPVTGNMFQNDYITTIGDYAYPNPLGSNFYGHINEVRIWNVARTESQIRAFMNNSLPTPTSQTGLLAYYTFDNLVNKQGNTMWDGVLTGAAAINTTNPNCAFVVDSCSIIVPVLLRDFKLSVVDNKKIALAWHTEEEAGISSYTIERSINETNNFQSIGTIASNRNSSSSGYTFIDHAVKPGVVYFYRLAIIENGAVKIYSDIRSAKIQPEIYLAPFANPSNSLLTLQLFGEYQHGQVSILTSDGRVVLRKILNGIRNSQIELDVSTLASGNYWLHIQTDQNKFSKKIIKL